MDAADLLRFEARSHGFELTTAEARQMIWRFATWQEALLSLLARRNGTREMWRAA